MTFSLRFTADLVVALAVRSFGNARGLNPILRLSSEHNFDSGPASTDRSRASDHSFQSVPRVPRFRSPIVWIGGAEPLDHPQVARFSNTLAASGRYVFVETSGASLKRRLHEFRPGSRFCLTVRFESPRRMFSEPLANDAGWRVGLEALRMARLAGFFTCAHLALHAADHAGELEQLHAKILELDVDGFFITPATRNLELEKTVSRLRRRLLSRPWALLSALLEASLAPSILRPSKATDRRSHSEPQPESLGESAEAG